MSLKHIPPKKPSSHDVLMRHVFRHDLPLPNVEWNKLHQFIMSDEFQKVLSYVYTKKVDEFQLTMLSGSDIIEAKEQIALTASAQNGIRDFLTDFYNTVLEEAQKAKGEEVK